MNNQNKPQHDADDYLFFSDEEEAPRRSDSSEYMENYDC